MRYIYIYIKAYFETLPKKWAIFFMPPVFMVHCPILDFIIYFSLIFALLPIYR